MYKKDDYKISGGFVTDIGNFRAVNQDSIFFRVEKMHGIALAVGAVCDGVGGLTRGELASGIIVRGLAEWYDNICETLDFRQTEAETLFSHLIDSAEVWNGMILSVIEEYGFKTGSTMSVIMVYKGKYFILQVGDSRIYEYKDELKQLTVDETSYKVKDGVMKGYLANHMGKREELAYMTTIGELQKDSFFLCCSDGFYHHLQNEDIEDLYLRNNKHMDYTAEAARLIEFMKQRGEKDNISLGIIYIE